MDTVVENLGRIVETHSKSFLEQLNHWKLEYTG